MFLKKNLVYLRNKQNISQQKMADDLGYKRSVYKNYEYDQEPDIDFLVKVSDYFKISIDDIIKKDLEANDIDFLQNKYGQINNQDNIRILAITVDKEDNENIQFVPEKAKAGYLTGYANPSYIGTLPSFRLPHLPTGTYRAFEIKGDSMPPISEQSIVIGKYVENWNYIKNLDTYIIITKDDGIVYKRVINKFSQNRKLILISDNPYYPPYQIDVNNILEIWAYHCHIDFGGNNLTNKKMIEKLLSMTEEVEQLDEKIKKRLY